LSSEPITVAFAFIGITQLSGLTPFVSLG